MQRRTFLVAAASSTLATSSFAKTAAPLRILAYGDSNTWGWQAAPKGEELPRHADAVRWPGVVQRALGPSCQVMANGLMARTFNTDLKTGIAGLKGEDHNGLKKLPMALLTENPVHLLVVMLGTNDLITQLNRSSVDVASGVREYAKIVTQLIEGHERVAGPRLLLVAPPALGDVSKGPFSDSFEPSSVRESEKLGKALGGVAAAAGIPFLDAGSVVKTDGMDGVHLSASAHRKLGAQVAHALQGLIQPAA